MPKHTSFNHEEEAGTAVAKKPVLSFSRDLGTAQFSNVRTPCKVFQALTKMSELAHSQWLPNVCAQELFQAVQKQTSVVIVCPC